jgi:Phage integrase, N-terminal SAM-like domain
MTGPAAMIGMWSIRATILIALYVCAGRRARARITALVGLGAERRHDAQRRSPHPYDGKRGRVWRIKYRDADDRQVMETIGRERDGVTRKVAEAELRDRLVNVDKRGWRKPAPLTFKTYAGEWFASGESRRGWKPKTVVQYRSVHRRLVDVFGPMRLAEIRPRHVAAFVTSQDGRRRTRSPVTFRCCTRSSRRPSVRSFAR